MSSCIDGQWTEACSLTSVISGKKNAPYVGGKENATLNFVTSNEYRIGGRFSTH